MHVEVGRQTTEYCKECSYNKGHTRFCGRAASQVRCGAQGGGAQGGGLPAGGGQHTRRVARSVLGGVARQGGRGCGAQGGQGGGSAPPHERLASARAAGRARSSRRTQAKAPCAMRSAMSFLCLSGRGVCV